MSPSDVATRRPAHQPSPPSVWIPSPQKAVPALQAQVARGKPEDSTRTDPFSDDRKTGSKASRSAPKLASEPSGKLARCCQASVQLTDSPTPKGVSRRKNGQNPAEEVPVLLQAAFAPPIPSR